MNDIRVLVAGVGNIFLGDDAFGVEVVSQLKHRPQPPGVQVVDFGIRGLDLTYALLEGYEAVVLVDAMPRGGQPGTLYLLEPETGESGDADVMVEGHNLNPVNVLRLAAAMGSPVKRLLVVGCEPCPLDEFEEMATELSKPVRTAVSEAVALVESLVKELLATSGGEAVSREIESCQK